MKKLLIALAAGLFAVSSYARSMDDFLFENDTQATIVGLYVSAHSADHWGPNVLHGYIQPDQYTKVYWKEQPASDIYDIRVVFSDGKFSFTRGYNLSTIRKMWVIYDGSSDELDLNWE